MRSHTTSGWTHRHRHRHRHVSSVSAREQSSEQPRVPFQAPMRRHAVSGVRNTRRTHTVARTHCAQRVAAHRAARQHTTRNKVSNKRRALCASERRISQRDSISDPPRGAPLAPRLFRCTSRRLHRLFRSHHHSHHHHHNNNNQHNQHSPPFAAMNFAEGGMPLCADVLKSFAIGRVSKEHVRVVCGGGGGMLVVGGWWWWSRLLVA